MLESSIEQLESACFGGGLPEQAEHHLRLAGLTYHEDKVAEGHLQKALECAPDHAAVLIGLYRYYFYKGRLSEALEVAKQCLTKSAIDNRLDADWRNVKQSDANFGSYESILPRFYLFSLKGYAYLQMRLGNLEEGRIAIDKLMELDVGNKLGGKVLLEVLEREGRDEDEDE